MDVSEDPSPLQIGESYVYYGNRGLSLSRLRREFSRGLLVLLEETHLGFSKWDRKTGETLSHGWEKWCQVVASRFGVIIDNNRGSSQYRRSKIHHRILSTNSAASDGKLTGKKPPSV